MKACVAASLATWRPPTTTPSSRSGSRALYGTETVGNFWDGDGERLPVAVAYPCLRVAGRHRMHTRQPVGDRIPICGQRTFQAVVQSSGESRPSPAAARISSTT